MQPILLTISNNNYNQQKVKGISNRLNRLRSSRMMNFKNILIHLLGSIYGTVHLSVIINEITVYD